MKFPPFEHLHFYEDLHGGRYLNISYSDMTAFTIPEFGRSLPADLDLNWSDPDGMPALRAKLAQLHAVPKDHVVVTTGATEANFLITAALVGPKDRVVVDAPMYSPLRDCARGFTRDVVEVPRRCEDGWTLDLDRIRKAAGPRTRLIVFCNLSNPTSARMSQSEMREVLEVAEERGAYVFVDETFREMDFREPPPSIASLGPRGIACSTVSKLYGLGVLRVGWIAAAPGVLRRVKGIKDYTTANPSGLTQVYADWALGRRAFFLRRARTIMERNRKLARETFDGMPALHGGVPDVGNVLFPHADADVSRLERLLIRKYRTIIAHGRFFAARGLRDHFRLGLGGKTPDLRRGLANLERALRELT